MTKPLRASPATVSRLLAAAGHVKSEKRSYHAASYGFETAGVRGPDGKFVQGVATVVYNTRFEDSAAAAGEFLAMYAATLATHFDLACMGGTSSVLRLCVRTKE